MCHPCIEDVTLCCPLASNAQLIIPSEPSLRALKIKPTASSRDHDGLTWPIKSKPCIPTLLCSQSRDGCQHSYAGASNSKTKITMDVLVRHFPERREYLFQEIRLFLQQNYGCGRQLARSLRRIQSVFPLQGSGFPTFTNFSRVYTLSEW